LKFKICSVFILIKQKNKKNAKANSKYSKPRYLNDENIAVSSQEQPQAIHRFVRLLSQKDSNYFLRCLIIPKILFFPTISNFSLLFRKL